jgi:hypothetical protein
MPKTSGGVFRPPTAYTARAPGADYNDFAWNVHVNDTAAGNLSILLHAENHS